MHRQPDDSDAIDHIQQQRQQQQQGQQGQQGQQAQHEGPEFWTIEMGEAAFFALLGTPNGAGVARMLASYPQMFGRGVITSAVVDPRGDPTLVWVVRRIEETEL